ncbi:MAG: Holliday junction resolvase Hjc [Candidatus Woesearchaeota archaeon]|nr:Holliday junction resolvase Hjc [Candidatus Woesearchaeota archaeon]
MSAKSRGINAERELIHAFWATKEWTACRVAGSGSMKYPCPDIIALSSSRRLAVECKLCSGDNQYLTAEEINDLRDYATRSGCEAWIAMRFSHEKWRFLRADHLPTTEKMYVISRTTATEKGLLFEQITNPS